MKNSFKTIMATVAALAISMSGMCITNANIIPPSEIGDVVGNSVTVNGNPATGEFNDVASIPVTFGAEHVLSVTIEFTDMKFDYSVKDDSWGEEDKLTITSNSTCPITAQIDIVFNTEDYPFLNDLGLSDSSTSYATLTSGEPLIIIFDKLCEFNENIHKYQFNDVEIGSFTITLTPNWQTL